MTAELSRTKDSRAGAWADCPSASGRNQPAHASTPDSGLQTARERPPTPVCGTWEAGSLRLNFRTRRQSRPLPELGLGVTCQRLIFMYR